MPSDSIARDSDVTVATSITLYTEYRGFFIYVISGTAMLAWMAWALIPDHILMNTFGITYYPDKYWSLAIPSYWLVCMLFAYIIMGLYNNEVKTYPLDDMRNFTDIYLVYVRNKAEVDIGGSKVRDIPVTLVNEILYGEIEEEKEE